jgi:hypothetical protein
MEQNFDSIYQMSFENNSFLELQKYCTDLISEEPNKIFDSVNLSSISGKLLISIIQSDNLQMAEIEIWEHVLKRGLSQNPELPSDPKNYSKDDFKSLKNTLQEFIPFIEFYDLTSKEFLDKVLPYEKIFPKDLYKGLLKAFLCLSDPNSKPIKQPESNMTKKSKKTVDSKIITRQHLELISKWIDRLEITDKLISSYEFKLLYRASRDGHSRSSFNWTCINKPRTVTLVKVKYSNEILGGYNPLEWECNTSSYGVTKDSFIFSFNDNDRIENYILSRVINEKKAIYNSNFYGPSFGYSDLIICSRFTSSYCQESSYENPIRKTTDYFDVEECEVFQIV